MPIYSIYVYGHNIIHILQLLSLSLMFNNNNNIQITRNNRSCLIIIIMVELIVSIAMMLLPAHYFLYWVNVLQSGVILAVLL